MASSVDEKHLIVPAKRVAVTDQRLIVDLKDGRQLSVPISWYPRLAHGTLAERANLKIDWYGIHWPDLDEDISIKGLLLGHKSGESKKSINRWLEYRARGEKVPVPTYPLPDWAKADQKRKSSHKLTRKGNGARRVA
jgi:hypothetical protein